MTRTTLALTLLFFFNLVGVVKAQDTWSLERCITHALENNLQVKQQNLTVETKENALAVAKMAHLPTLNASASHSYSFGRAIDYGSNQVSNDIISTSFSINANLTLFNGFEILNSRKQSQTNYLAAKSDIETTKNSIAIQIALGYLQILFSEELVNSSTTQVELSKMQVERTRVLVNAGSLPEGNLFEMEAQLAGDEAQLVNAQNQLDLAYLTLTQMLDLKSADNFKVEKPNNVDIEDKLIATNPQEIYNISMGIMPQIKSSELGVESANYGLKIAKGRYLPQLSLSASYSSGARQFLKENPLVAEVPFETQIKDNASTYLGFSLSIPIFNGLQTRKGVSNAKINLYSSQIDLENQKNSLYKDIQQAYADALAALKKYKSTQKSLQALEEAFRYSEQKFNLGMVTSIDYTTAKNKLAKAQTDLLQAKYEFIFKSKILDFYKGEALKL
ncbi:MAG: TolC family protein [Bacteroidales bacterium]|nr:TolC family protein [Bacteroidales bacterium]MBN2749281.1 TolC family protein [Bacteroidales bacterium]